MVSSGRPDESRPILRHVSLTVFFARLISRASTASSPWRARQITATLTCLLVFVAALAGTAWLVRAVGPQAPIPQITDKLAAYADIDRKVNVLFFGTSKTYSGVIPQIFDELVQRAGIEVRAFNAGIDGMRLPETGWFCEQFLARRPPGLKWVFLEVGPVRPKTPPAHEGTRRATLWRDWPRTVQAVQAARHLHAGSADVLQE